MLGLLRMSADGTTRTLRNVRYSVAVRCKADFEHAASVIVLCARQGGSLGSGAAALAQKEFFRRTDRDTPIGIGAAGGACGRRPSRACDCSSNGLQLFQNLENRAITEMNASMEAATMGNQTISFDNDYRWFRHALGYGLVATVAITLSGTALPQEQRRDATRSRIDVRGPPLQEMDR